MAWEPDVSIVGIGETDYFMQGQVTDRSEFELACEAITKAVDDAGIDMDQVDGFASYAGDRNDPARLSTALGLPEHHFTNMVWGGGGGGGSAAVMNAALAVHSGACEYVVAFRSLCQGQFGRFGQAQAGGRARDDGAFSAPYGLQTPPQMFALATQRYMHEYDVPKEWLGHVSLNSRHHANRNPRAVFYDRELTMEEYLDSRMISDPLQLFDCCLENDGACAVVLTTTENARELDHPPARILAAGQGGGPSFRGGFTGSNMPVEDYTTANARTVADQIWAGAGIGPEDIDVAQFYENFTGMVLMAVEDYGFAPRGKAGELFASGETRWPDGDLPINTSGGNLAEAYIHGFELIAEATRQIRGTSTSQVDDVQYSLVASGPGVNPHSGLILEAV